MFSTKTVAYSKGKKMKNIFVLLLLSFVFICQPAYALELHDAKSQGLVGETTTGYLAAVNSDNEAVQNLVSSINSKRKEYYLGIAKKNNTPLQTVEQLAGKKAIEKTPAGQFVHDGSAWKKK